MSTLPFLLSVADELDNLHSQSYMDDFGLGFHPHRQYYRTPTIQLSLPASTDWMQQERQRCRTHKFVFENQNNLAAAAVADAEDEEAGNGGGDGDEYGDRYGASTSSEGRQKYTSALNSNDRCSGGVGSVAGRGRSHAGDGDDDDNIDNSVQMYNLSKKCCKNYHRHTSERTATTGTTRGKCNDGGNVGSGGGSGVGGGGGVYKLNSKCLEGNNSSSDESLQKPASSIEFLTCFLVKKSRASKNTNSGGRDASGGGGKKS